MSLYSRLVSGCDLSHTFAHYSEFSGREPSSASRFNASRAEQLRGHPRSAAARFPRTRISLVLGPLGSDQ